MAKPDYELRKTVDEIVDALKTRGEGYVHTITLSHSELRNARSTRVRYYAPLRARGLKVTINVNIPAGIMRVSLACAPKRTGHTYLSAELLDQIPPIGEYLDADELLKYEEYDSVPNDTQDEIQTHYPKLLQQLPDQCTNRIVITWAPSDEDLKEINRALKPGGSYICGVEKPQKASTTRCHSNMTARVNPKQSRKVYKC